MEHAMREVIEHGRERKRSEVAQPGIGHNSRTGFNQMRDAFQWQLLADKELNTPAEVKIGVAISLLLNRKDYDRGGVLHAWPSLDTIAERTGTSRSTARRVIRKIATLGHIRIIEGGCGTRSPHRYVAVIKDACRAETMQ